MTRSETTEVEQSTLTYTVVHEAWYWQALRTDYPFEIGIERSAVDGGCFWEFCVRWVVLSDEPCPQVRVFDDAWQAFEEIPLFFAGLGRLRDTTPAGVVALLDSLGFTDTTKRHRRDDDV